MRAWHGQVLRVDPSDLYLCIHELVRRLGDVRRQTTHFHAKRVESFKQNRAFEGAPEGARENPEQVAIELVHMATLHVAARGKEPDHTSLRNDRGCDVRAG